MKKHEIGRACSAHGRVEKCIKILVGSPKGTDHSEDLGVGGSLVLEWI